MRTARIFIGSSSEALDVAQAVRGLLADDADVTVWKEGFFRQGHGFLEDLSTSPGSFDFAIFIATPDDLTTTRGEVHLSPRDNILFELGLFIGKLGRERVRLIHPRNPRLKLPSDLQGVVTASAVWPQSDGGRGGRCSREQYMIALGAVCDEIRDSLREWQSKARGDVLLDPGLLCCYTNTAEVQAAIGKAIATAKSEMFFMGVNFSYTLILNDVEFKDKVESGVDVKFLVLNPTSHILGYIARGGAISEERLRTENQLYLKAIYDLQLHADSRRQESPSVGKILIRLYDAIPLGRAYVFDGLEGESLFVPYTTPGPVRQLPVYHFTNSGKAAGRYVAGMKELWESGDTISIDAFLDAYPEFWNSPG